MAASLCLTQYIPAERMHTQQKSSETRPELIRRWLHTNTSDTDDVVLFYYDDRANNVEEVNQTWFGDRVVVYATHVTSIQTLFNLVRKNQSPF